MLCTGGYDPLLAENVEHFVELKKLAHKLDLIGDDQLVSKEDFKEGEDQVTFLRYVVSSNLQHFAAHPFIIPFAPSVRYRIRRGTICSLDAQPSFTLPRTNTLVRCLRCLPSKLISLALNLCILAGIVPVEAMYAGAPVIACNSGGPKESVLNEVSTFLMHLRSLTLSACFLMCR